jgi:hypothetical protein
LRVVGGVVGLALAFGGAILEELVLSASILPTNVLGVSREAAEGAGSGVEFVK